jgi:transcriptional regulator with XRE-family HTH domain
MEQVARELLRALRGPRSQLQLSRRLGYRSNPVAEWEGGRRWPAATELLRVAELGGIDVAAAFARFHPGAAPALGDPPDLAAWLTALKGDQAIGAVAAAVGRSRSAVSRWLSGQTQLDVCDLLAVIDALTGRVADFVGALVPIDAVPALAPVHERARVARRLLVDEPWALAVLACVQTTTFLGRPVPGPGEVARALGIDEATAGSCLTALEAAGVLVRTERGYDAALDKVVVDTQAVPGGADRLRRHWTEVALSRLATRGPDDQYGYAVFSVSHDDLAQLRELHRAYYRQVRAIASASSPTDLVVLLNLQLVALTGPSAG